MRNAKLFLAIFLLLFFVGCSKKSKIIESNKNNKDNDGAIIGTSNKENNDKLQVKVIIDKINIRQEATVNSNKIGVVEKNSLFDVLDYVKDKKYIWFKIKTDNDLNGYIASEIDSPYVETNKEIDFIPPSISIKEQIISVDYRNNADSAVRNNVSYSDNIDSNPLLEYEINYKKQNDFIYDVSIKVTDSSKNVSNEKFKIKITSEKQISEDVWISYNDLINKQKKAKSLCSKYGLNPWKDAIGCISSSNSIMVANYSGTTRIGLGSPFTYCNYDRNLKPEFCEDGTGNTISHDLISNELKSLENKWLPIFKNYMENVKNETGFDLYDLQW